MQAFRIIGRFIGSSLQQETAYRANFFIGLLHSFLNLGTGVLSVFIFFGQVTAINGWNAPATLTLLGVYLTVAALRDLFISPSMDMLAGMGQEVVSGKFDFVLLKPVDTQFLISIRSWRLFSLLDLGLGLGVICVSLNLPGQAFQAANLPAFLITMLAAVGVVYALMLAFTALVFWSPGFVFAWVFDAVFQLARYPVDLYPNWLRWLLTWIVPVALMTSVPAGVLVRGLGWQTVFSAFAVALLMILAASVFFRLALRRYASASS